jgi:hypothetical protein
MRHCHIEQVEAVFDRGEAKLRHWNRVAGLSPGRQYKHVKPANAFGAYHREAESPIADFLYPLGYRTASGTASPKRRDNAFTPVIGLM